LIVIDSSAIVALLLMEADAERVGQALGHANRRLLPSPAFLETSMVMFGRNGLRGHEQLEEIIPFTHSHARAAADGFLRFGKGRHPAGLNFGDCMSYAVAKVEGRPLLYVGADFGATDVVGVLE
jgi:ribonuclease VapC